VAGNAKNITLFNIGRTHVLQGQRIWIYAIRLNYGLYNWPPNIKKPTLTVGVCRCVRWRGSAAAASFLMLRWKDYALLYRPIRLTSQPR